MLFTSCEKEVEYVQIPQREIPLAYLNSKESSMTILTNDYRNSIGLPRLKTSLTLYHLAKDYCFKMKESNVLSHAGFYDRYLASEALFFGECVSYNFYTAEDNFSAFLNSAPHKAIFDNEIFEYFAVADVDNWCCVLFARWRPYNANNYGKWEIQTFITENNNLINPKTK